jgi:hypothetical protein
VHQITAGADLDGLNAALGELRAAGWPAPEDPGGDDDAELDGRDLIRDRLVDEVSGLRQCAGWLTHLHTSEYPPAVNLRPDGDHPGRALVVVDLPRVAAILQRVAADIDELARARRVADLGVAAALPDRRASRSLVTIALEFRDYAAGRLLAPLIRRQARRQLPKDQKRLKSCSNIAGRPNLQHRTGQQAARPARPTARDSSACRITDSSAGAQNNPCLSAHFRPVDRRRNRAIR